MAQSTGIVLAATGISFANEWLDSGTPNFRVIAAGLLLALLFDGIEKISPEGAVGLATIALITVVVTPFGGKSPAQTLAGLAISQKSTQTQTSVNGVPLTQVAAN